MNEYSYHRVFYDATATSPDYVGVDAVATAAKADERRRVLDVIRAAQEKRKNDHCTSRTYYIGVLTDVEDYLSQGGDDDRD